MLSTKKTRTLARIGKFAIIGILLSLFNFFVYTFLARIIFNTNELLWLDSIISYSLATILAYILHSKITWKERPVDKRGIIMFFVWNGITAFIISPLLTLFFGLITPVYQFVFNVFQSIHIPFDYNFVESTGIFCFTTAITMILNYLFYDKLVFGHQNHQETIIQPIHDNPLVSIIVPIYNTSKYLPKCLNSILNQTYNNLEIILVDDGSTDNSGKIAEEYAKKDQRIKVIHQKNAGQSSARNVGLKKATGDFISFIDSDDETKPNFIKELLNLYSSKTSVSIAICGHQYKRVQKNTSKNLYQSPLRPRHKHETQKAYVLQLLAKDGRMYSCNNKLFRASIIKNSSLTFDTNLNFAEDTKFVLDYLKCAKGEISYTPNPLYVYNYGTNTSTIKKSGTKWSNWKKSYENLKKWVGKKPTFSEKIWLYLVYLRWHISYYRSKHRSKS